MRGTLSLATARSKVWLIKVGVDGGAVGLGEHVAVVAALAGGHALLELAAAVAAQLGDGSGIEVNVAAAGGRLEVALDELVLNRHDLLADGEAGCVEVDVVPQQAGDLAPAHPGGRGEQVQRIELMVGHRVEEAAQLVAGPHADRPAAAADRGRIGGVGHIADDGALAGRVGQRALQGGVDVANRLGRQAAPAADALAVGEELDVQLVEVLGLEPLQRDGPNIGDDVQADVALIGVGRRRLHPWSAWTAFTGAAGSRPR